MTDDDDLYNGIIPGGVEGSSHSGVSGGEAAGSGGSNILVEGGSALSRYQLGSRGGDTAWAH